MVRTCLKPATGFFSSSESYVLQTMLVTLGIPHKSHDGGGFILWPENEEGAHSELVIDNSSLAEAFHSLARIEEENDACRDEHGRFPFARSAFAQDFGRPVDALLSRLAAMISEAVQRQYRRWQPASAWPNDAPFAVCLTHDVDWVRKWSGRSLLTHLATAGWQMIRGPQRARGGHKMLRDFSSAWRRENPYWNLLDIAREEKEHGFRSTFFFLAGRHHANDGDYVLDDPKIVQVIETLLAEEFEVGLHGSYLSFERPELLASELSQLQAVAGKAWGGRQHYLRFAVQSTLREYERLGLRYDATLGFAEREGYRSGFSFPYYPYCLEAGRPFAVMEIPLTIMDVTLGRYRGLDATQAWLAIERQLEYMKSSGGCCSLLWHNNYFDEADYPGYGELYWRALAWVAERGGWATSAREICSWWRQRAAAVTLSPE